MHVSASEGFICGIQHILMLRPDSVHDTDKMVIITLLQGLTFYTHMHMCIYDFVYHYTTSASFFREELRYIMQLQWTVLISVTCCLIKEPTPVKGTWRRRHHWIMLWWNRMSLWWHFSHVIIPQWVISLDSRGKRDNDIRLARMLQYILMYFNCFLTLLFFLGVNQIIAVYTVILLVV